MPIGGKRCVAQSLIGSSRSGEETMKPKIPHVVGAKYLRDRVLMIEFSDKVFREVDFRPYLARGGVFAPLKDLAFFKRFFVDLNTVCWPNGADVSPERLFELGRSVKKLRAA